MQVTPEEYTELDKLDDATQVTVMKALQAAGDIPAAERRKLMEQAIANCEAQDVARSEADYGDIMPDNAEMTIAGRPVRKMSAGILRILEIIDHPMASKSDAEIAMELEDILVLLYIMTELDNAKLWSEVHSKTLIAAAMLWSMDLTVDEIELMQNEAAPILAMLDGGVPEMMDDDSGNVKARSAG